MQQSFLSAVFLFIFSFCVVSCSNEAPQKTPDYQPTVDATAQVKENYNNVLQQQEEEVQKMINKRDSLEKENDKQRRIAEFNRVQQEEKRIENERVEDERRENERKTSGSATRSNSQYNSDKEKVVFNTAFDVMAYICSNKFISSDDGSVYMFKEEALYVNGQPLTGAPEVTSFYGSTATIRVYCPYLGGAALIFHVDALRGILSDNSGAVCYKK